MPNSGTESGGHPTYAIGGDVKKAGSKSWVEGMTLSEVIKAAGGAKNQSSLKRVKLYRGAKVTVYDLTKEENQRVKILNGDAIEVPLANEMDTE